MFKCIDHFIKLREKNNYIGFEDMWDTLALESELKIKDEACIYSKIGIYDLDFKVGETMYYKIKRRKK